MFYKFIRAIFRFLIFFLMPTKVIGGEGLDRKRQIYTCLQSSDGYGYTAAYSQMSARN